MRKLIYFVLAALAMYLAFSKSLTLGLLVMIVVLAAAIYAIYPSYTIGRANAEFNKGNYEGALSRYRKITGANRAKVGTYVDYATILMRTGNVDEALCQINRVLALKRDVTTTRYAKQTRAMINYRLGNLKEAKEEIDELFDEGFKTINTYSLMGYLMLTLNYPLDETLRVCEEAYDYDNEARDIIDNLMVCHFKLGNYDRAKELSDKLCEEAPKFVEAFYHGAELYEAMGDIQKAKELAEHLSECKRSVMTTITEQEQEALVKRLL